MVQVFLELQLITISGQHVKVSKITVAGSRLNIPYTTIASDAGTLDMKAAVEPYNAFNQAVTWIVETIHDAGKGMTGDAIINPVSGLLTAKADGTVKVKAYAQDGSGIVGEEVITVSGQVVKVTSIVVTAISDKVVIGTSLQMTANIYPSTATTKTVTWAVSDLTKAEIGTDGKLTAKADGVVTVTATSTDGIIGSTTITIGL